MTFISCCLAWAASLFACRIPGRHGKTYLKAGHHSWAHLAPESARAYTERIVTHPSAAHTPPAVATRSVASKSAPDTWSPYAREVAEIAAHGFVDTTSLIRPRARQERQHASTPVLVGDDACTSAVAVAV